MELLDQKTIEFYKYIRDVKDFPKPGIIFKDLTPLFKDSDSLLQVIDIFHEKYSLLNITKVACIEARGFLLGGAIANKLRAGLVPIRKPGKLPWKTYSEKYELEYGFDEIHVHTDAFNENDVVLLHDDLLATGGTMKACIDLVRRFNVKKIYVSFICELQFLKGRDRIGSELDCFSLMKF